MTGFVGHIEELTQNNAAFRHVIFTAKHSQLVLMHLNPNEDIGLEMHDTVDQFFRVESGTGKVIMNGEEHLISDGDAIIVPAGTQHNIINTSSEQPLKLYTIYSPPNHRDGVVHQTKHDAEMDETDIPEV